MKLQLMK